MGSLFSKSKKPQSRVTEQDKAVLQLKQQRDRLKQYQRRIETSLEKDRELARKCLRTGRKDRAKLLLRKKKFQETLLSNTDKQLENLEKLAADLEYAQVELQVLDGLKAGNAALKQVHAIMDISEIEKIMDETHEGIEKQHEIDSILSDALTQQDEEDVLAELDALVDDEEMVHALPDVPQEDLPENKKSLEEEEDGEVDEVKQPAKLHKASREKQRVLLEA